ncbi:MAG: DUF3040 domain-containing protein [Streptosporangiaceae bacterium]
MNSAPDQRLLRQIEDGLYADDLPFSTRFARRQRLLGRRRPVAAAGRLVVTGITWLPRAVIAASVAQLRAVEGAARNSEPG